MCRLRTPCRLIRMAITWLPARAALEAGAAHARAAVASGRVIGAARSARDGARVGIEPRTVRQWRQRWRAERGGAERYGDAPRAGAPATFTAEQVCAIIALACEPPSASGRPITHWSQSELAREAVRRGVAERISQRSVGRMLKRSRPQAASGASLAHAQA